MTLTIQIDVDNDAFHFGGALGDILFAIGYAVDDSETLEHDRTIVHDLNGNTVGWYEVK